MNYEQNSNTNTWNNNALIQGALNSTATMPFSTGMTMMLSTPYGIVPCYMASAPQVPSETPVQYQSNNAPTSNTSVLRSYTPRPQRNLNQNLTVYGVIDLYKFSNKDYYFFYESVRSVGPRELPLSQREFRIDSKGIQNHNTTEYRYGNLRCNFLRLIDIIQECDPLVKFILSPYPTKDGKKVIVCIRNTTINGYLKVVNRNDKYTMLGNSKSGYFCLQKRKIIPY